MEKTTLILLSDYGIGDPAFTEVLLHFRKLLPGIFTHSQSTPAFSTISTGFWLAQFALGDHPDTYIFSNTAPRKEDKKAQTNNNGEKLMYVELANGFELMAINAGYNLSFIKKYIKDFFFVKTANEGSQFRSRDIYPLAVAKMIRGEKGFRGEKADPSRIPDIPSSVIASIDGYGNIKTTIHNSETQYTPGQKLSVSIGGKTQVAIYTDGVFNIHEGELAFAPGSSGHKDRFMELFVRGGSAAKFFSDPSLETNITISEG
ncbi:MAG: SAM-dependent chlorinase/fluorinase [Candidatus Levybacteria bacterium]|nr:SAM-dependent chlorinase/fluorinase [Candidatus Levybacteria bacterium]